VKLLEDIVKATYLRDVLVEDHFSKYGDTYDHTVKDREYAEAMESLNIRLTEQEVEETYRDFMGRNKTLKCKYVDLAVEDNERVRTIEELQKEVLDKVYKFFK
jgi:hypothetical protein